MDVGNIHPTGKNGDPFSKKWNQRKNGWTKGPIRRKEKSKKSKIELVANKQMVLFGYQIKEMEVGCFLRSLILMELHPCSAFCILRARSAASRARE